MTSGFRGERFERGSREPGLSPRGRGDLDELLAELCADPRAPLFEIGPPHLARALSGAFASWEARAELRRAEVELRHVHRLELAVLLRSASQLRAGGESCGALFPYEPPSAPTPRAFAARAVEVLEGLRLDGLELSGAGLLAQLLRSDPVRWPGAVELARAAGYYACWAADEAEPVERHRAATMALAFAGDELYGVGASAVQIHAGIGFTWEHDIHLFYKRLLTLQQTGGGSVDQLEELASIALD